MSNSEGDPLEREMNLTEVERRVQAAFGNHRPSQTYATDGYSQEYEHSQRGIREKKTEIVNDEGPEEITILTETENLLARTGPRKVNEAKKIVLGNT